MDEKEYIGDGVYVRFDGYAFHMAVNHHLNEVMVIEPEVLDRLIEFRKQVIEKMKQT